MNYAKQARKKRVLKKHPCNESKQDLALLWIHKKNSILSQNQLYQEAEFLSHNKPCFQCNIDLGITNSLVSHICELILHDVIDSTVHMHSEHLGQSLDRASDVCRRSNMLRKLTCIAGRCY